MRVKTKVLAAIGIVGVSWFGWWGADVPIGYYQFKERCEKEGGFSSFGKVDHAQGWLAEDESEAEFIVFSFPNVPFARFKSKNGEWWDVKFKGGGRWRSESYLVQPARNGKVGYKLSHYYENVADSIRLRRSIDALIEVGADKTVFKYTSFDFTWTDPNKTLLGRSGVIQCPAAKDMVKSFRSSL